jgi:hypothetical protein
MEESGSGPRDREHEDPERAHPDDDRGSATADTWADEEWADESLAEGAHTALPPKVEAWRRRSAAGAILTGFALGLQEALEKRKEEPSIVMETSGDPPKDLPVEADFEYGRPRHSVVQIRPWLLPEQGAGDTDPGPAASAADDGREEP